MGGALSTYLVSSLVSPTASSSLSSTTAAASTTTALIESSSTSAAAVTSLATAAMDHGLSNGAIAGIVVSVAVPTLALVVVAVLYVLRKRKSKKEAATATTNTPSPFPPAGFEGSHEPKDTYGRPAPVSWDASTYADEQTLATLRASGVYEPQPQPWPVEVEGSNERSDGVAELRGSGVWNDGAVVSGKSDARNTRE